MKTIDLIKEVAQTLADNMVAIKTKFSKVEGKLKGVEQSIKDFTPFDPTELEKDIHTVKEDVRNLDITYDDSTLLKALDELKATIPKAYDDSAIRKELEDSVELLMSDIPKAYDDRWVKDFKKDYDEELPKTVIKEIDSRIEKATPEAFDSSELEAKIEAVEKAIPEIPKGYDDTELQKQINGIKGLLEKEVSEIKKAIDSPIQVEASTTKHYNGEVTKAGDMVLHENNLYVNLLEGNDSTPSDMNKSYKLLIEAPKSPEHQGVYKADKTYSHNDMVMWENSTWIKTTDSNQTLPSEGWKLVAKAVKGRRGDKGEKGDEGIVDYDAAIQDLMDEVAILKAKVEGYEHGTTED